jgi:glycosyltransferase involved in cell wall biosynthesis
MHFLLVGDGLKMPDVLAHIGDESCREFVTLTGLVRQDQAPLYLAASDVLLSPHVRNPDGSRFFGSPTKLYEYMAMGKSIVASDLEQLGATLSPALKARAIPECGPGPGTQDVAVLCEPGSVEDLIAAIRFLAESPGWRKALGTNARRTALSRYTWQHHVGAILEGLDRVAAKTTEGSAELEACEFQPR